MASHRRTPSIASATKTTTPIDWWDSYFDSWTVEDHEVPQLPAPAIIEPMIVDNDLYHHEDLLHENFNIDNALNLDLDWGIDHHYQAYEARCSPRAFGRLTNANASSKRHGILVSRRRSSKYNPRGQGQSVHQIHQIRKDPQPAPVRRRPHNVDARRVAMANATTQPCAAPHDASLQSFKANQEQQYPTNTFWKANLTATAKEARRVGKADKIVVQPRKENSRAPQAASAAGLLSLDQSVSAPIPCMISSLVSFCTPPRASSLFVLDPRHCPQLDLHSRLSHRLQLSLLIVFTLQRLHLRFQQSGLRRYSEPNTISLPATLAESSNFPALRHLTLGLFSPACICLHNQLFLLPFRPRPQLPSPSVPTYRRPLKFRPQSLLLCLYSPLLSDR